MTEEQFNEIKRLLRSIDSNTGNLTHTTNDLDDVFKKLESIEVVLQFINASLRELANNQ